MTWSRDTFPFEVDGSNRLGMFNPFDYGATGNGVTDDSAAIQAVEDAASAANGTVIFPPGTYYLGSTTINGHINTNWVGVSLNAIIAGSGKPLVLISYFDPSVDPTKGQTIAMQKPRFHGLTFQTDIANGALAIHGDFYAALGTPECVISECTFDGRKNDNSTATNLLELIYTYATSIEKCKFQGPRLIASANVTAISLNATTVTFISQTDTETCGVGVASNRFLGNADQGLQVVNSLIDGGGFGIVMAGSVGCTITGSTIDNHSSGPSINLTGAQGVNIVGNYVGNNCGASTGIGAIQVDGSSEVTIADNNIVNYQSGNYGVRLGSAGAYGQVHISGNTFASTSVAAFIFGQAQNATPFTLITDNTLQGAYTSGAILFQNLPSGTLAPRIYTRGNTQYNPQASVAAVGYAGAPSVPTSGTAIQNPYPFDITIYYQNGVSATTMAVSNLVITIPANAFVPIDWPWGATLTANYAAGAPTWVWYGR